ncbi:protein POLLENLESS 3-like [Juglans microcarpa x Juglans regia]|uniref:protein POLLENLESS 3-like n=1 Tax=Juglans microcarpa x Juglans regia TaxID=2249226 RepID=UPI001B7DD4C9|nr:protein POLLENLESS 3-like [Juglans microcarpa x Juglans regia]
MWSNGKNFPARGFSTPPPVRKPRPMMPLSERKRSSPANNGDLFHVIHKVPAGDSPYVRAKHVQLIDKDPNRAISLFWAAINAGDRVDSALKDMSIVMKQLDRSDEAIEAIKSFRHLCPYDSQESLDNVLVELYKRSGRIEEEIQMLQLKLKRIEDGIAFGGRRTKTARSQGKKVQITIEQEVSRILGNLAWAYLQQSNYKAAEEHYRKALSLEPDKNKQCNLAICLMHMNKIAEAASLLHDVRVSSGNRQMDESYAKSYERALQMLTDLESQPAPSNEPSRFSFGQNQIEDKDNFFWHGNETRQCKSFGQRISLQSSPQTSADKCVKDPHFEYSGDRMSGFSNRLKENGVGSTGTETTPTCKNAYSSPSSTGRNLNVLFTQPRRSPWGIDNEYQSRKILGNDAVRSSSRKLTFEPPVTTENVQADSIHDVNGDWRRSCRDLARLKGESVIKSMSMNYARTSESSVDRGWDQSSGITISGHEKPITSEESFRKGSPGVPDGLHRPSTEILQSSHDNNKKSWADMVEEEEQELQSGSMLNKYSDGWNVEEYNDENLNTNIMCQSPYPESQIKNLSYKYESFDVKDLNSTSGAGVLSRNPAVQRSMNFNQQQKPESTDYSYSSPMPKMDLNFEGRGSEKANGRDYSMSEEKEKLMRRNRLQVFRDITP